MPALKPTATISTPDVMAPMLGMKARTPVTRPSSAAIGTPPIVSISQVNTPSKIMLKEGNDPTRQANQRARTDADGPPLLAVDNRLVIPAGKVVKFIVTADDVIHSFAVPAFWVKQDANPGQLHETWAKVDKPGVYFGQCSELCGARHAFMSLVLGWAAAAAFRRRF